MTATWKVSAVILIATALLPIQAGASCLSTEQVMSLQSIMDEVNITGDERSAFLSIFDFYCNRSYNKQEISEITSDLDGRMNSTEELINSTINEKIGNYTSWFEEKVRISEEIGKMAEIYNRTYSREEISNILEDKKLALIDTVDTRMSDWNSEKKELADKDDLKELELNLTGAMERKLTSRLDAAQSRGRTDWSIFGFVIVILVIAGLLWWKKNKVDKRAAGILDSFRGDPDKKKYLTPDKRKLSDQELSEITESDEFKKRQREARNKFLDSEKETISKVMEDEERNESLKNKLKNNKKK